MRAQLLLLTFGVFVWLLTVFLSAWRKRRQRAAPRDVGPHVPLILPRSVPLPPPRVVASRGMSVPARRRVPPSASARRKTGSRRDVRRGMVLMTILGPCAALSNDRILLGEAPRT
jgi:hypothetical protein